MKKTKNIHPRMPRLLRCLPLLGLSAVLVFTALPQPAFAAVSGAPGAQSSAITVHTPSREEIVKYMQEHPTGDIYFDEDGKSTGKVHETAYETVPSTEAPYAAGRLAEAEEAAALNTIKTIRYIAGISDNLYISEEYTQLAQASALVNYVNGKLTHTPSQPSGMELTLAQKGREGSQRSNISWTEWQENSLKWSILSGWMDDSDASNISLLGHRRWILNPAMSMTGFGSVTGSKGTYQAMYVYDKENRDSDYTGVCWPARNMPTSYFSASSAWSISLGKELDPAGVVVSMVRFSDGKSWTFSSFSADGDFYVNNSAYGQKGCIIFRPAGIDGYKNGDRFFVYIAGLDEPISYEVSFFDAEHFYSTSAPTADTPGCNEFGDPVLTWTMPENAERCNLYRRCAGGKWQLIASELDEPFFEDASAGRGIKYYYRLTSLRTVGGTDYESFPSAAVSITTSLRKPTFSSLRSAGHGMNMLKWKAVSKASGYKVYRRAKTGSKWSKWTLVKTTNTLSYRDVKAKPGTTYEYRVRAYRTYYKNVVNGTYSVKKAIRTR